MALHTGEAQLRNERNYMGTVIVRCARLRALAHGGQILVSNATAEVLGDGLPGNVALLPLGVHRLRDLDRPERVFQVSHPQLPSRFAPLRSLGALPNNLPIQTTSFIGRQRELTDLQRLVTRTRVVTLVGVGGCGKSRLATQVAADVGEAHPDGVWWVDLAPVSDPERVPHAALAALGIGDFRGRDPLERLTGHLAGQRVLLVVDNCEHLLAAAARLVDAVRRSCAEAVAIATSREPLDLPGELVWQVPSLSLPPVGQEVSIEHVDRYDALRLFVDRAVSALPGFALDDESVDIVAKVCSRLDGLALSIELAAARVQSLSPRHIHEGLADRFRLLTGGASTALPRQQTLEASVE